MIAAFTVVGLGLLGVAQRTVPPLRRRLRARRLRRRRLVAAARAEERCRLTMDELCPFGWRAEITVISGPAEMTAERAGPEEMRVTLEWTALGPGADPAPRQIWAPTVAAALEAMVADRITDETLAQIELQALSEGAEWPEG
jgi:hypothetical protein